MTVLRGRELCGMLQPDGGVDKALPLCFVGSVEKMLRERRFLERLLHLFYFVLAPLLRSTQLPPSHTVQKPLSGYTTVQDNSEANTGGAPLKPA